MKINEVIVEGKLRKASQLALPDAEVYDELDNSNPYQLYRFGMALASAPGPITPDKQGPTGSHLVTIAYTDGERQIIDKAKAEYGVTSKKASSLGSAELPTVNTTSPVAARSKNKYGI
jgi:hypothetical protein